MIKSKSSQNNIISLPRTLQTNPYPRFSNFHIRIILSYCVIPFLFTVVVHSSNPIDYQRRDIYIAGMNIFAGDISVGLLGIGGGSDYVNRSNLFQEADRLFQHNVTEQLQRFDIRAIYSNYLHSMVITTGNKKKIIYCVFNILKF